MIRVSADDFSVNEEYDHLLRLGETGAIVIFVGRVREFSEKSCSFYLQHYPGMTEKVLQKIETESQQRWPLQQTSIIHRVGELKPGDQIVFVGVSAAHRHDAFDACQFMIDILKTEAPFWKKEGEHWVEAKITDNEAAERWLKA